MKQIFQILEKHKLSPNQLYLLYSIREGVSALNINIAVENRLLEGSPWMKEGKLTDDSIKLLKEVDSLFSVNRLKAEKKVLGEDVQENIKAYNEIFPRMVLPHGKAARSNVREVSDNFVWFFNNYEYSWDIVLDATVNYVNEFATNGYKFMRSSKYFIRKQNSDKTWTSDLAEYCELLKSGVEIESKKFKDNVT